MPLELSCKDRNVEQEKEPQQKLCLLYIELVHLKEPRVHYKHTRDAMAKEE